MEIIHREKESRRRRGKGETETLPVIYFDLFGKVVIFPRSNLHLAPSVVATIRCDGWREGVLSFFICVDGRVRARAFLGVYRGASRGEARPTQARGGEARGGEAR